VKELQILRNTNPKPLPEKLNRTKSKRTVVPTLKFSSILLGKNKKERPKA